MLCEMKYLFNHDGFLLLEVFPPLDHIEPGLINKVHFQILLWESEVINLINLIVLNPKLRNVQSVFDLHVGHSKSV